jgi:hypothetical protein
MNIFINLYCGYGGVLELNCSLVWCPATGLLHGLEIMQQSN